jgi:ubiquitin carboxyl-terminal hydrolase 15
VTVIGTDGSTEPSQHTISMSKSAELKHFIQGLGASCSLRDDETLLIASVYLLINYATFYCCSLIISQE